ncbi:MAG: response regulator transcription factor [Dehalococcoidia bacterium]|nr:response regulator transcription factor [Dehalococcoidia bacterium]
MNNILLVSNEVDRVRDLSAGLSRMGFSCTACIYADDVIQQDARQLFNAVLIDISSISTYGDSAWKWFRKLKLRRLLPVIALVSSSTLHLVLEQDFEDFIIKPWNLDELSARIRRAISETTKPDRDLVIKVGDLTIDPVRCEVELSGRLLALTFKEYELLKLLATNKGKVFTRESLLNEIWGYDYYGGDRTVDVHIRRLRSKIEDPAHSFIETVRNIGYKFKETGSSD